MNGLRSFIFLVVITLLCCPVAGNSNTRNSFIKKEQWHKYSKGYNYSEKYKTAEFKPKLNEPRSNFSPFAGPFIKYFVWMLIILLIGSALVLLIINISRNSGNKVIREKIRTGQVIDNIEETDLEYLLEQSLTNGLYKDAIRFRYLILIRSLNRIKYIAWKKDKTNGTYIREMFDKSCFEIFRQLTINFERIWYGEQVIDEKEYHALIPIFDRINKIIESE